MEFAILALLTGTVRPFRGTDQPSAIAKLPVDGPVAIGPLGLAGDEQADRRVHGGPDKAIHHYPGDHYPFWREETGGHPLLEGPGAFGENVSTLGLTESEVCIGDRYRLGGALVEVSQGRQPCWKQGHRFGIPRITARMVETRRAGWYYRVLESGEACAGDSLSLVERTLPEWTVERVFGLLIAGDHIRDTVAVRSLAALPVLAEPWRLRARALA
ncbi:MAG: MOSC domain-containing protein [Novosphingobium sp.]